MNHEVDCGKLEETEAYLAEMYQKALEAGKPRGIIEVALQLIMAIKSTCGTEDIDTAYLRQKVNYAVKILNRVLRDLNRGKRR